MARSLAILAVKMVNLLAFYYVMFTVVQVKELEPCLGGSRGKSQIIWTSSSNAKKESFSINDIQHMNG